MSQLSIEMFGNVQRCLTEAEVSWVLTDGSSQEIASICETTSGWQIEIHSEDLAKELGSSFDAAIEDAKTSLQHYVNRLGTNPPEGLTEVGLSFWLMEKDDGTAMGVPIQR